MIKSLRLRNFKGFESLDLPELAHITLIGGRNNVGKSSLLEAIFLFYDQANPAMFLRHLSWRGFELITLDANSIISPMFRNFDLEHPLIITVSDDIYRVEIKMTFIPTYTQKSINIDLPASSISIPQAQVDFAPMTSYALDIDYHIDGVGDQKTRLVIKQSTSNANVQFEPGSTQSFPERLRRAVIYLGLRMKLDPGEDAQRFGQLDIEKRSNRVIDFLKILEPNVVGLSAVPGPQKSMMYADIGMNLKIPVAFMGDGVSRLLSIILAIATAKNGIVLIDEIDAGIHHSMTTKVWEGLCSAAREFNCQIIATTHSYEALQTADDGVSSANMARNFRYIRLDRDEENIVAKIYTHKVLGAALERGWEVR
jgi:AAA domain, putative AbiEii toxin, Type IV TA system